MIYVHYFHINRNRYGDARSFTLQVIRMDRERTSRNISGIWFGTANEKMKITSDTDLPEFKSINVYTCIRKYSFSLPFPDEGLLPEMIV